jgi:hypothetical protein
MKLTDIKLPSNKKFGFFFSVVFLVVATYFFFIERQTAAYILFGIALVFLIITVFKAESLMPLNKLWMRFGILLGMIISPIVLAFIFFGLITPYGIFMRLIGRDELRLKIQTKKSYWIHRPKRFPETNFKQQF